MINSRTVYSCSICNKDYTTQSMSENCYSICKEKEDYKKDLKQTVENIRLNTSSVSHLKEQLISFSRNFLGADLEFSTFDFTYSESTSNTHGCPLNGRTNFEWKETLLRGYPGFSGRIEGRFVPIKANSINFVLKQPDEEASLQHLRDLLPFFHTGTGGGAKEFRYSAYFFIQDFPKMQEQYTKHRKVSKALNNFDAELTKRTQETERICMDVYKTDKELKDIYKKVDDLTKEIDALELKRNQRIQAIRNDVWDKQDKKYPVNKNALSRLRARLSKYSGFLS